MPNDGDIAIEYIYKKRSLLHAFMLHFFCYQFRAYKKTLYFIYYILKMYFG